MTQTRLRRTPENVRHFELNFKETYKIEIHFPVARLGVTGLTMQYYNLASTNKSAKLRVQPVNENCSILIVEFLHEHDTKKGLKNIILICVKIFDF